MGVYSTAKNPDRVVQANPYSPGSVDHVPFAFVDVVLTATDAILADNDVIADTQEVANAFPAPNQCAILESVQLMSEDDIAQDIDLFFLGANVSLGTENSAISITDADARNIQAVVSILIADYVDLIASQQAFKGSIGKMVKSAADSTSFYIAAVLRSGTPTFTASGLRVRLGLRYV